MKKSLGLNKKIGILGGGQLGRMMIQKALDWDLEIHVLDPNPNAPCSKIAHKFVTGDWKDYNTVMAFGVEMDLITVEIEHINVQALHDLKKKGITIAPNPKILETVQDKGLQKKFYKKNDIPTSAFKLVKQEGKLPKTPIVQKLRSGGYDGKGVAVIRNKKDREKAFTEPSVVEDLIDFEKELSVIVARNQNGDVEVFPTVEQEFNKEANVVEFLFAPAKISDHIEKQAKKIAKKVAKAYDLVGIMAVELFLTQKGDLLVNEVAPRPHNSGHHTIEACKTSQFEQHLRAILNLPLGDTELLESAVMVNILGDKKAKGRAQYQNIEEILDQSGVFPHIYGKKEVKPYRKMGHITITASKTDIAIEKARWVQSKIKAVGQ